MFDSANSAVSAVLMLGVGLHTSTLQTTTSEIFLLSNNQYHVSRVPDTERSL